MEAKEGNPRIPRVSFHISSSEKDKKWKEELGEYSKDFEAEWRKVEEKVLRSFETVAGRKWPDKAIHEGIAVVFSGTAIPHSYPDVVLRHRDYSDWARQNDKKGEKLSFLRQTSVLVHELAHRFETKKALDYVFDNFLDQVNSANLTNDPRPLDIAIKSSARHVNTELLWKAVMLECFPEEVVRKEEERQSNVAPIYVEAYRFINSLSEEEKNKIVNLNGQENS